VQSANKTTFIAYPTNRVVGTITDAKSARGAIEALLAAGIPSEAIDVLHGDEALHRLDPTGEEHGFLTRFQRTLIRFAAVNEEARHLSKHVEDVRAGRFVVMVLAPRVEERTLAATTLQSYGAKDIGFYGRWAWQAMGEQASAERSDEQSGLPLGQIHEARFDNVTLRFRLESPNAISIPNAASGVDVFEVLSSEIRPGVFVLSWRDGDGTNVVHIDDFDQGVIHAHLTNRDGTVWRAKGTLRRLPSGSFD
jgi:hypothetical protein